jgi:thiamine pyrophosphate-dependent acetolactate synthase large subunit-like protein
VLAGNEQGASLMATGYARATGKVSVSGDGGLMMNVQEIATAARQRVRR